MDHAGMFGIMVVVMPVKKRMFVFMKMGKCPVTEVPASMIVLVMVLMCMQVCIMILIFFLVMFMFVTVRDIVIV